MALPRPSRALLVTSTLAGLACGGGGNGGGMPPGPTPTQIAKPATGSGDNQIGPAGQALPTPLAVVVRDASDQPVAGVTVGWAASAGSGSITPQSSTDANGIATATWTLGANAGAQTATASKAGLAGSPVSFSATAQIQGATQMAKAPTGSGDGQTDTVLVTLTTPYRVLVRDQNGAAVPGVTVSWTVTAGGGSVSAPTSISDGSGFAVITHTFGSTAGAQTVRAAVTGLIGSPVTFTSTALPGVATEIAKSGGDGQTGAINTALATPHSVIVRDSHGNGVPGFTVSWVAGDGGGSVNPAATMTGATGVASTVRTLGPIIGTQTDTAKAVGLAGSPLVFTATARQPVTVNVTVNDNFFSPQNVTVGVGDTVKWTWNGSPHNVTWQDGFPASPTQGPPATYTRILAAAGLFRYRCTIHSSNFTTGMIGSVTVP